MMKLVFSVFAALPLAFIPAAASAQDAGAGNMGGAVTTDAAAFCQGEATCLASLQQCRDDLERNSKVAKDAVEALNRCESQLAKARPRAKRVAPTPPQCTGPFMNPASCTCRMNPDGTGEKSPALVPVKAWNANLVQCVTRADLLALVEAQARRIAALEGKAPDWDAAHQRITLLLNLVSDGEPQQFAAQWTDLLAWYAEAQEGLSQVKSQVAILVANDQTTQAALAALCPLLPDRPQASMVERCDAAARAGKGTQVSVRVAGEVVGGYRPGADGYQGVRIRLEGAYNVPGTQSAFVASVYGGRLWDQQTGGQILGGGDAGYRYYFSRDREANIDLLAYVQQYYSVHGAGHQGVLNDKGMGGEGGARVRAAYCVTRGLCFNGEVSGGYAPRINYFPHAYRLDAASGATVSGALGISGHADLF